MFRQAPALIRRMVSETRMRQIMRWMLIFAIGFYLGQIAQDITCHSPAHMVGIE